MEYQVSYLNWLRCQWKTLATSWKSRKAVTQFWIECRARGGAVLWGTAIQAARSRVRFSKPLFGIFHWDNPSGRTMTLGLTLHLTEMSPRNISLGVKAAGVYGWQPYHFHVLIVLKSGSLNLLEPSGAVQGCNGTALPFSKCNRHLWEHLETDTAFVQADATPECVSQKTELQIGLFTAELNYSQWHSPTNITERRHVPSNTTIRQPWHDNLLA